MDDKLRHLIEQHGGYITRKEIISNRYLYYRLLETVKSGEIIPPDETKLEALLSVARGHPDNEGTQAARRLLKKRYGIISW